MATVVDKERSTYLVPSIEEANEKIPAAALPTVQKSWMPTLSRYEIPIAEDVAVEPGVMPAVPNKGYVTRTFFEEPKDPPGSQD